MKPKKLEKKTAFIFKKNVINDLSKDQMNKINGGGTNGGDWSGNPACKNFSVKTVSN